ncbi:TPA: aldehyde dehydrogenase family protein [Pseudomonas putida]
MFIHDGIYAPFIDKLKQAVSRITLGDPMSESTRLICLINQKQGETSPQLHRRGARGGCETAHRQTAP